MYGRPSLKGAWLGHGIHLNFGGHKPYPKWLIVSDAVSLVRSDCYKLLMVVGQLLITPTIEICIQQLGQVG